MLRALYPHWCNDQDVSHIAFSLARYLAPTDLKAELWVLRRGPRARAAFVRPVMSREAHWVVTRANRRLQPGVDWANRLFEARAGRAFRAGDIAHVYPGCSPELMRALRARGHAVFLERWGEMDDAVARVTEDAFARAGWPFEYYTFMRSQAVIDLDQARTEAADFVFSPHPGVTGSLLARGISPARILETSYGWDPHRFEGTTRALPPSDGVTVLFVGRIGVTKGAHLLLQAWQRAGVAGRLVLLGQIEPMISKYCGDQLSRPDVVHLPYTHDPAPVYRSADVFALPTLTEGGPLVTYEAMANGLPAVVSPAGAGRIVRDGVEGFVVDPHDADGWVAALRRLATDREIRQSMGEAARTRVAEFTWSLVAERRHALIRDALSRSVGP